MEKDGASKRNREELVDYVVLIGANKRAVSLDENKVFSTECDTRLCWKYFFFFFLNQAIAFLNATVNLSCDLGVVFKVHSHRFSFSFGNLCSFPSLSSKIKKRS